MVQTWLAVLGYVFASTAGLIWRVEFAVESFMDSGHVHALRYNAGLTKVNAQQAVVSFVMTHLQQNPVSVVIMLNFAASMYILSALVTKALFLGDLTAIERNKLVERLVKYVMLKMVFVGAVATPTVADVAMWLTWFSVIGYLKMFLGLARDRIEGLLSSPSARPVAHARCLLLVVVILGNDVSWAAAYRRTYPSATWSRLSLWLFDTVVIALEVAQILAKYGVHMYDKWRIAQAESAAARLTSDAAASPPSAIVAPIGGHWEGKGAALYHLDLAFDVAAHGLTLLHYAHIWWLHGFAFQLIDAILFLDMRALAGALHVRLRGFARYRAATHNLRHSFPDATPEQLTAHDDDCAICKEPMQAAKVLPCGHMYHLACLRAWLQQSGSDNFTCPFCRAPLFAAKPAPSARAETPPVSQRQRRPQQPFDAAAADSVLGWGRELFWGPGPPPEPANPHRPYRTDQAVLAIGQQPAAATAHHNFRAWYEQSRGAAAGAVFSEENHPGSGTLGSFRSVSVGPSRGWVDDGEVWSADRGIMRSAHPRDAVPIFGQAAWAPPQHLPPWLHAVPQESHLEWGWPQAASWFGLRHRPRHHQGPPAASPQLSTPFGPPRRPASATAAAAGSTHRAAFVDGKFAEREDRLQQQLRAVKEVLPQASDAVVLAELRRTGDVNRAVDSLLARL